MKRLIMMVGLPRSGKTTRALKLAKKYGAPIVNPDSIRKVIHGENFRLASEPIVWGIAKTMVSALFLAGHDCVIVDACNITRERRNEWRYHINSVLSESCVFELQVIATPVSICRDRAVNESSLLEAINRMNANYEEPTSLPCFIEIIK